MSKKSVEITQIPVPGTANEFLVVSICYQKTGINYWHCKEEQGGYYVSVNKETIKVEHRTLPNGNPYTINSRQFMPATSGLKALVEGATRFSQKKLDTLADQAVCNPNLYQPLLKEVAFKHGIDYRQLQAAVLEPVTTN